LLRRVAPQSKIVPSRGVPGGSEEALCRCWSWRRTTNRLARQAVPIGRHNVVDVVTDGARYQCAKRREAPRAAQIASDRESSLRFGKRPPRPSFKPNNRVDASKRRMLKSRTLRKRAVQRSKAELALPVSSEDELHYAAAEPTRSVIEQDWLRKVVRWWKRCHLSDAIKSMQRVSGTEPTSCRTHPSRDW
jgi:hypothetical protein